MRAQRHRWWWVASLLPLVAQAVCPIVTSTADTGPGTLRDCITQANLSPNKEVITFDPTVFRSSSPGVIALQADLPSLTDPGGTEISGPSATAVIIDGAGYTPGRGLVLTAGKNVIRNLTVRNFRGTGFIEGTAIWLQSGSSGNEVSGCVLSDNGGVGLNFDGDNRDNIASGNTFARDAYFGIRMAPSNATCATKNLITQNTFSANGVGTSGDGMYAFGMTCLQVVGNTFKDNVSNFGLRLGSLSRQCLISGNTFTANTRPIGVYGGAHDNQFLFNTFFDNRGITFQIGDTGSADNLVAGNVIVRNTLLLGDTFAVHAYDGADGTRVFNNTFHQSEGNAVRVEPGVMRVRVQNNIFSGHSREVLDLREPSVLLSHNDYFNNAAGNCTNCAPLGSGNLTVDPGFVSPGSPTDDYRLGSCSGPVNAGLDLGTDQLDLTPASDGVRFFGSAPDQGALESPCGGATDAGVIIPTDGGVMIITSPGLTASCGRPYVYSDGPAQLGSATQVLWVVESAPEGFSIGRNSGAVTWTPRPTQVGEQSVTLQAITQQGIIRQRFAVEVECTPGVFGVGCACGTPGGLSFFSLGALLFILRRRNRNQSDYNPRPCSTSSRL